MVDMVFTKDFPVEKFFRDCKLCTIGEGTSEIQKLVISRKILKELKPRFYNSKRQLFS